jgi:hypothetical protein
MFSLYQYIGKSMLGTQTGEQLNTGRGFSGCGIDMRTFWMFPVRQTGAAECIY